MVDDDVIQIRELLNFFTPLLLLDFDLVEVFLGSTDGRRLYANSMRFELNRVAGVSFVVPTTAGTEVANNDVVRRDAKRAPFEANSFARSGLAGDGDVRMLDCDFAARFLAFTGNLTGWWHAASEVAGTMCP